MGLSDKTKNTTTQKQCLLENRAKAKYYLKKHIHTYNDPRYHEIMR